MALGFDPAVHGYRFSNNYTKWKWGPFSGKYLCGGMAYSAIDYWQSGLAIPKQEDVPQEGDGLHKLIYDRQFDAHRSTVMRFGTCWLNEVSSDPEWDILVDYIRAGVPIPMCLYKTWHGHHTVAYAVNPDEGFIRFYDPNYPKMKCTLYDTGSGFKHSNEAEPWRGFFIDTGYSYRKPPMMEGDFGWLKCFDCRLLYKPSVKSLCPRNGAAHNGFGSAKYVLSKNGGHGRSGWKLCWKCGTLFWGGAGASGGLCPDGGIHNPLQNTDYSLAIDGEGQGNWRRCIYCEGLFWLSGGGKGGICPGEGMHESDLDTIYHIPFQ